MAGYDPALAGMENAKKTDRAEADASALLRSDRTDPPLDEFRIWPHRSLPPEGHRHVLLFTCAMFCIPLIPAFAAGIGWTLLPFLSAAAAMLWYFLRRNTRDGAAQWEHIRIWPDLITVERHDPRRAPRRWAANPYWVQVQIHKDASLENYLTLRGDGREIELGAFLSPEERISLKDDLERALGRARSGG